MRDLIMSLKEKCVKVKDLKDGMQVEVMCIDRGGVEDVEETFVGVVNIEDGKIYDENECYVCINDLYLAKDLEIFGFTYVANRIVE